MELVFNTSDIACSSSLLNISILGFDTLGAGMAFIIFFFTSSSICALVIAAFNSLCILFLLLSDILGRLL